MTVILKIIKYELRDVFRGKWLIIYGILFWLMTDLLLRFSGQSSHVIMSLVNIVLIFIPLVSVIFGTLYLYNSREFIVLLLSQPINRMHLYIGMYIGIAIPLVSGFTVGISIPILYSGLENISELLAIILILATGIILTLIFLALAFMIALGTEDRAKGLGFAILLWLFFTVIYDGLILIAIYLYSDYPLEHATIFMSLMNPIDLGRIIILMQFDIAAMMGYTGAVFQRFFGSSLGLMISVGAMAIWIFWPLYGGLRRFLRKDF